MKLLTISGSLRAHSFNTRLLAHTEGLAREVGHRVRRFDRVGDIPPFDEDREQQPIGLVEDLRAEVRRCDAVLIATPEYSGSIPGQLKNVLDWAARPAGQSPFIDLPVTVISASPSQYGGAWARQTTEHVLTRMGAAVLTTGWGLPLAHQLAADDTGFLDDQIQRRLHAIIDWLAEASGAARRAAETVGARPPCRCHRSPPPCQCRKPGRASGSGLP